MSTEKLTAEPAAWFETRMTCPPATAPTETGAVDWHDLHLNGMPAVHRTIARLEKALARLETAQRAAIAELDERIAELEYLKSEEIIDRLAPPSELRAVVAELGAGWRIERSPADETLTQEANHATE